MISIACPPSFRSDITPSTLSSDSSIAAALSHRSDLNHTLKSLLKELRVLVSSVRGFPSAERDSVHTLFQDTSLTLPWLTGRVTGQSTVFAVAAMVLQYLRAVGLGHAASEVSSPKRSQESSAHSLIHVATTAIETCFTLLEEANVGPAPQSYMQPWWPVMSAAVDIISVTAREGSVVSNLIARFMAVFNSNASKQLSALLEDSLDSLMVLPHRAEAGVQKGTQPWMAHLTDNVALLLTVPRLPSQSMVVEESKLQEGGGDVPARVVMHMLLKWLVTAFGDQTQSQTPGGTHTSLVPVFLDPVHAVVLLTFSTYLDASLDGVLAGAEGPAPSRSTLWLRTDMKVMQDACFAIRSHTLIGGPSLAVDDTIPESIRALFRLVLSLNTNASLPLLDALARLYAGTGKVKESRPSLPLLSPFPSEASPPSHADPVTAAYTACAVAVMKQHLWESALTSGPAHTLIGLRSVVDAFAHALYLASRVYEGQLVEALVSSCQTLSHRVQSLRLSSPADASAAQLLIDNLSTTCGEALQGIKGLEALIPLYYAVYFVGPSFGEAERGRWFVYRARDTCGGLEFLAQLGKSFPSATVVSADTPITVGTSDLAVFGGAAGPVEPPPAIPSVPPSPAESVYYGSYTFLGSGVHGVGSQVTLTPTGTGHTLSHYSQTTTAVVTPPSHIYVYPAVPLHPHTSHSHHASQLNTDTTLPGAPTSAPGFRVWACRGVTRYTPLPGTIPGPRPSIQHPIRCVPVCVCVWAPAVWQ